LADAGFASVLLGFVIIAFGVIIATVIYFSVVESIL